MTAGPVTPVTTRAPKGTIGDALSGRDNALNFVRLILASAVIFWHSYPVLGVEPEWPAWLLGAWAVNGFFALSGYLIAGSRMRLRWWPYLQRRAVRIFPAFWVVLAATGFIFAPLAAWISGNPYRPADGAGFVLQNALLWMGQFNVGETLAGSPVDDSWNGSLWTLFFEFAAYLGAMVLLGLAWVRRRPVLVMSLVVAGFALARVAGVGAGYPPPFDQLWQVVRLGSFFAAGMLLFFLRDRVRASWGTVLLSGALVALTAVVGVADVLGPLPFAVLLLSLGAVLPVRLGAVNDISYGVYVYAFPVQQLLYLLTPGLAPMLFSCVALALTVPPAAASWWWVERPALRLVRRR